MQKLIIILTSLFIILLLIGVNHLILIVRARKDIETAQKNLKAAVMKYMDMIPLLLTLQSKNDPQTYELRASWYDNYRNPNLHWPIYIDLKAKLKSYTESLNPKTPLEKNLKNRIEKNQIDINESVHTYNEHVINYLKRLKKTRYNLISKLDFKRPKNLPDLLEESS